MKYHIKRISDPIHGTIGISAFETEVINTRIFQRLRNVKHLGLAYYVYPGADYSRFSHSVGTCHVAAKILDAVRLSLSATDSVSDDEYRLYRIAGLLHDIGHYPYSHAMENAIANYYKRQIYENNAGSESPINTDDDGVIRTAWDHERVGKEIWENEPELLTVFQRNGFDPKSLTEVLTPIGTPRFANLISSDLDADRIDYLMRTAHHTGLPYGSVDLEYILSQIRFDKNGRLCFSYKALRTIDHFLLSRYFDYQQVSFHKTVVGLELVLKDVLGELLVRGQIDGAPEWIKSAIKNGSWIDFDDVSIFNQVRELALMETSDSTKLKCSSLLCRNPPKLVAEIEFLDQRNDQVERDFNRQRKMLTERVGEWAGRFGIDHSLWYIWPKIMPLTIIGPDMPISAALRAAPEDIEEIRKLVHVVMRDGNVKPIVEIRQSLMSILSKAALYAIRVYVLLPETDSARVQETRQQIETHIKHSVPDMEWK